MKRLSKTASALLLEREMGAVGKAKAKLEDARYQTQVLRSSIKFAEDGIPQVLTDLRQLRKELTCYRAKVREAEGELKKLDAARKEAKAQKASALTRQIRRAEDKLARRKQLVYEADRFIRRHGEIHEAILAEISDCIRRLEQVDGWVKEAEQAVKAAERELSEAAKTPKVVMLEGRGKRYITQSLTIEEAYHYAEN